jgi:hypothetical protein
VDRGRVLHRDEEVALGAAVAHLGDGGRAVAEQAVAERGLGPGPRHHLRAVQGADVRLVVLDDVVDQLRVDQPLLDQQGLERLDADGGVVGHAGTR